MQAGITLAGYHVEKGARSFSDFARAMIADLGDMVRRYMKIRYLAVTHPRQAEFAPAMEGAPAVESADIQALSILIHWMQPRSNRLQARRQMNYDQLHKMLNQALKDKAPAAYRKMRDRRTLDRYLGSLTTSALETKDQLETQAIDAVRNQSSPDFQKDYQKSTQELNNRFKAAEETAVAQAIEAIDALQKPSETYETMESLPPGPRASGKAKLPIRRELILENLERNKNNPPKRRKSPPSNVVPFRKPSKS